MDEDKFKVNNFSISEIFIKNGFILIKLNFLLILCYNNYNDRMLTLPYGKDKKDKRNFKILWCISKRYSCVT
jgi:hypothetical protein